MIAAASTIQVVAMWTALGLGGVCAFIGLFAEYRRQLRDWRRRRDATSRAQVRRERLRIAAAETKLGFDDPSEELRWL